MSGMNPRVDAYLGISDKWREAQTALRQILLSCPLVEDVKWGVPCYTLGGANVVLMHEFKDYCALLFHKGALLSDPAGILVQQTENVQAARQIRFTSLEQVLEMEPTIRAYILEAIEVEKSGRKVELKKTTEFTMPEEFRTRLEQSPALKAAFEALTPGRQRGYLLHFSSAKQAKTRVARVAKYIPQILEGKGLED